MLTLLIFAFGAGDVTAIAEENARRREAATVARMCSETALALQKEHHDLFEELCSWQIT